MLTSLACRALHKYLDERYADRVVLTFGQIESLLGFTLPPQALIDPAWWNTATVDGGELLTDAWRLANRTAAPNILARNVVFERIA